MAWRITMLMDKYRTDMSPSNDSPFLYSKVFPRAIAAIIDVTILKLPKFLVLTPFLFIDSYQFSEFASGRQFEFVILISLSSFLNTIISLLYFTLKETKPMP